VTKRADMGKNGGQGKAIEGEANTRKILKKEFSEKPASGEGGKAFW